ncbi:MAG: FGGY-family carbohydrate kinase [Candidatus Atribacteria bacterium]|nr:FGGY-family carbohydrate kinase [Candidatus Atribacteria bacterium]
MLATTALATGAGEKGTLSLCVGTAAQLLFCLEEIDPDILGKLYLFSHCLPDKYFCLGTVPTGGSSVQWFASLVGDKAMKRLPAKINGLHDIPLNRNTLFYPFLMGTGTPSFDYQARAALFGLEMNTDQKDIALSIMEGVALALKSSLKKVPSLEKDVKRIIMSGGGTRLTLWPQIMGNVFNIPVQVSENVDTAATGAYLLGAKAIHFIDNYDDTINTTTPEAKCIPDPKFVSHYSKLYELYATFTDAVEKYSHWSER